MATVTYQQHQLQLDVNDDGSLLDALLAAGHAIPHSCRAGTCHSCMMQTLVGTPPAAAQSGLKETQKQQGYFLACKCQPSDNLTVSLPGGVGSHSATVHGLSKAADDVLRLWLDSDIRYKPGQFVNLVRDDGLSRSYSIASVPELDEGLEFHIRILANGQFSTWAGDELQPGTELNIQGPFGDCFYSASHSAQPMLLAATGTGLAPLYGIARDALQQGHQAPIYLFAGARNPAGLYLLDELQALASAYPHFHYVPVVLEMPSAGTATTIDGLQVGDLNQVIKNELPSLAGFAVYLCGSAQRVNSLRKQVFLAGASMREIYFDLFTPASP